MEVTPVKHAAFVSEYNLFACPEWPQAISPTISSEDIDLLFIAQNFLFEKDSFHLL